jgi:hypothetical protein
LILKKKKEEAAWTLAEKNHNTQKEKKIDPSQLKIVTETENPTHIISKTPQESTIKNCFFCFFGFLFKKKNWNVFQSPS